MAAGYAQVAFESIVGNETNSPTLSTKLLYPPLVQCTLNLNAKPMMRDDELRNVDEPFAVLPEIYDPSWSYQSRAYPDLTGMFLKSILGAPVSTAGDGIITDLDAVVVPTGVTRHTWTSPYGPAGINPQTMQIQAAYKDETVFYKLKGAACAQLDLTSPVSGGVQLKASGLGTFMQRVSDPALTPTYEALTVRPFTRNNLAIATWLASTAVHEDFTVSIANPHEAVRTLGISSRFPDDIEKLDPPIIVTGTLPQRVINTQDWDALLNGTGFAAEIRWTSDSIIASGYPYKLIFKLANAQYVAGDANPLENKRRIGSSFNWKATNATGSAGSVQIQLMNATASYA